VSLSELLAAKISEHTSRSGAGGSFNVVPVSVWKLLLWGSESSPPVFAAPGTGRSHGHRSNGGESTTPCTGMGRLGEDRRIWSFLWFGGVKAPCGVALHLPFEAWEKFVAKALHSGLSLVFTDTSNGQPNRGGPAGSH